MAVRGNAMLERLRQGKLALGFGLYHLRTVAGPGIALATGHHWVFLDAEHGPFGMSEITELCTASLAIGVTPVVRFSKSALDHAARALDNGAQGVIVPMVESADEARHIVDTLRHQPVGRRGIGGCGTRFDYRVPKPDIAMVELNATTMVIAMIETPLGVENAEKIAAVPGIDALFVGLQDLSVGLGVPGRFEAAEVEAAFTLISRACSASGKILGMGGLYDDVIAPRFVAMGARMIATGNDHGFLLSAASARVSALMKNIGGCDVPDS